MGGGSWGLEICGEAPMTDQSAASGSLQQQAAPPPPSHRGLTALIIALAGGMLTAGAIVLVSANSSSGGPQTFDRGDCRYGCCGPDNGPWGSIAACGGSEELQRADSPRCNREASRVRGRRH